MTLYYDNGKVVIMHDITVETFNKCKNNFVTHNTDVKIVVNDLIPYTSIDDIQEFDINIILKIFTKCIDALGTDYTKYLYISKETNNRYECDGWNYGCIYISKNKSSDQLIVLLEDLLDEYWIVEKD
jgi:hypothetical protein